MNEKNKNGMNKHRILLRADDLGYSRGVNYAIYDSLKAGAVKSAGLMVNMPESAHGANLVSDLDCALGLHVSISNEAPAAPLDEVSSLVDENGMFFSSRHFHSMDEDEMLEKQALAETRAQIEKFISLTGKKPDYVDAHSVSSSFFNRGIEQAAREYKIPFQPLRYDRGICYFESQPVRLILPGGKAQPVNLEEVMEELAQNKDDAVDILVLHPGYLDAYLNTHSSLTTRRMSEADFACGPYLRAFEKTHPEAALTEYRDLVQG